MPRIITAVLSALLLAASALAIDLTPRYFMTESQGMALRFPYFVDGGKNYGLWLDENTELSARNGGAYFKFTGCLYATMEWKPSPFTPGVPFDADHLPKYLVAATQCIPNGATKVKIEGEEDNVYPMNNWVCHRYTISYVFYGYAMRDSVTFLNLNNKEQILIQVSARDVDFKDIADRSWNVIRSWRELKSTKFEIPTL